MDGALLNARERRVRLVEGDDLDLAQLAGLLERLEHERRVVGEEAHHAADVGILRERVLGVGLALGLVELIGERAEDFEAAAFEHLVGGVEVARVLGPAEDGVNRALATALGVVLLHPTDEDHDCAALGHGLAHEVAAHAPGLVVVHADVNEAVGVGRVGVVGDELGALGGGVEEVGLVRRVNRADGDAIHALGEQVLNHPLLVADALDGHERLRVHAELLAGGLHARSGDGPERRDTIRDEGDFLFLAGLGRRSRTLAGFGGGVSGLVASGEAEQERGDGGEGEEDVFVHGNQFGFSSSVRYESSHRPSKSQRSRYSLALS